MGGFFGVASKHDCVFDLFFGPVFARGPPRFVPSFANLIFLHSNFKLCLIGKGPITPFEFAFLHAKPRAGVR